MATSATARSGQRRGAPPTRRAAPSPRRAAAARRVAEAGRSARPGQVRAGSRSGTRAGGRSGTRTGVRVGARTKRTQAKRTPAKRTPATALPVSPLVPVLLGCVWAVLLVAAVSLGSVPAEVILIPVGLVATVSAVRAATAFPAPARKGKGRRRRAGRGPLVSPPVLLGVACSVLLPLVALGGPVPAVAVAVLAVAVTGVALVGRQPGTSPLSLLVAVLGPAVATMSVALARNQGSSLAVTFVAAVCLYDMGSFIVGSGRGALGGWAGVAAGVVSVVVLAFFVAAVMDPPFSGVRPWIMLGLVAVAAPAGVALASRVAPGDRLPALLRLDALILSAPLWVVGVAVLLHQ